MDNYLRHAMKIRLMFFITVLTTTFYGQVYKSKNLVDFVPKGYIIQKYQGGVFAEGWNEIKGDLNKDGLDDIILIIKGTDKKNLIKDENRGILDRNRRGIIVLLNKKDHYELGIRNYNCFSSENEDGGVYSAPELSVEIKGGNLHINYLHGRYGQWSYTFRFQNSDFELIGYDESNNRGPVTESRTSINFSTKKKNLEVNTNPDADDGDEVFKTTYKKIHIEKLIKLSEIKNFDDLDMSVY